MAHAGGRPSKYDPRFIEVAREYLEEANGQNMKLPSIEGLAIKIGVDDETIGLWAKAHEEFSATIKELKHKQKEQLMEDGMYGGKEVNSAMAIFLLKANHGMADRIDVTSGGEKLTGPTVFIPQEKNE